MVTINHVRKFLVQLTPPIFYPFFLRAVNSNLVHGVLKTSGQNFYKPTWHTIPKGKLKGIKLYIDSTSGEWERTMTTGEYDNYFTNYLAKLPLKNKVFFDVGAHVGYSSFTFAKLAKGKSKIIAFEPNEFNRERFELHLENNPELAKMIQVKPIALSNKDGQQDFVFTNNVDGWTSSGSFLAGAHTRLEKDDYEKRYGFTRKKVPTMTMDSFVRKEKLIPDIVKIDIEGAEHIALAGARKTLTEHKPLLLIEVHSIFAAVASMEILAEVGYVTTILFEDTDGRIFIASNSGKKVSGSRRSKGR